MERGGQDKPSHQSAKQGLVNETTQTKTLWLQKPGMLIFQPENHMAF